MSHQKDAVSSGYWPLYRFHPSEIEDGQPFKLDSRSRRSRSRSSWPPRPASPSSSGRSRSAPPSSRARPGRCRRALALLRAARGHAAQRPPPAASRHDGLRHRARRSLPPARGRPREKETGRERRPAHRLPGPASCARRSWPRRRPQRQPEHGARLERAGVGAIVLPSLFEEEISRGDRAPRSLEQGTEQFAEALDYFPGVGAFVGAGDRYLGRRSGGSSAGVGVPVIASLNACTVGGWVRYAQRIQDAGADALELNLYRVAADRD